jgi:hypothetical protein
MENMKKIVMLFLATMVLAGASFAQATTTSKPADNGMASDSKSDSAAPKKTKKAKKAKAPKAHKSHKAAATTEAPAATPAK